MREAAHDIGLFYGKGKRATLPGPQEGPTKGKGGLKAGFPHQPPCFSTHFKDGVSLSSSLCFLLGCCEGVMVGGTSMERQDQATARDCGQELPLSYACSLQPAVSELPFYPAGLLRDLGSGVPPSSRANPLYLWSCLSFTEPTSSPRYILFDF